MARTFFVTASASDKVKITAGAINNVACSATELTITAGDKVYIEVTHDAEGAITVVSISSGATVPSDDFTDGLPATTYLLLATTATVGGRLVATPVAWNVMQQQACNGVMLWGGFGE